MGVFVKFNFIIIVIGTYLKSKNKHLMLGKTLLKLKKKITLYFAQDAKIDKLFARFSSTKL
jgi:hypothetical protein